MKILYISSSIVPSRSANSIHVMKMCEAFAQNGHEVVLVARRGQYLNRDLFDYYGVAPIFKLIFLPWTFPKLGGLIYGWFSSYVLLVLKPDVVYARNIYGATISSFAGNYPIIFEVHTPPQNLLHYWLQKKLFISTSFKHLVVISKSLQEEYKRLFPNISNKIMVAHDGANPPKDNLNLQIVKDWPGRPKALQVGYAGSLYPGKGIEIIIKLAECLPQFDFHIFGGEKNEIIRWKSCINTDNLFFHGFIEPVKVPLYLSMCDILLLPPQRKVTLTASGKGDIAAWMSPLKLFEYMACRRPIVASDLPVIQEVLEHEKSALLVQPDDIESWKKALQKLASDSVLRRKLADNAWHMLITNYTWRIRATRVLCEVRT